jgi:hypothetical protein
LSRTTGHIEAAGSTISAAVCLTLCLLLPLIQAATRAPLVAREDWRETPAAVPITQAHVANADLELLVLGPGAAGGMVLDLSRGGAIRWRSRQSGFTELHPIVQLEDGQWLVADQADGASEEWRVHEFATADLTWRTLNAATIVEGRSVSRLSLTAVGFTDLMQGGGTPASSRLDWIEIYGFSARR